MELNHFLLIIRTIMAAEESFVFYLCRKVKLLQLGDKRVIADVFITCLLENLLRRNRRSFGCVLSVVLKIGAWLSS